MRAMSMTTGSIRAATATLFMKADNTPLMVMINGTRIKRLRPATLSNRRPKMLAMPVRVKPPLRINTAQMVITAGLLKPESASSGDTMPVTASDPRTSRAKTSSGIHSVMRNTITAARMMKTMMISIDPIGRAL